MAADPSHTSPASRTPPSPATGRVRSPPGLTFNAVTGSWTVPASRPRPTAASSATWIGIDGGPSSPDSIIQTGTAQNTDGGNTSYHAWFELYPAAPVAIGGVSPGRPDGGQHPENSSGSSWLVHDPGPVSHRRRLLAVNDAYGGPGAVGGVDRGVARRPWAAAATRAGQLRIGDVHRHDLPSRRRRSTSRRSTWSTRAATSSPRRDARRRRAEPGPSPTPTCRASAATGWSDRTAASSPSARPSSTVRPGACTCSGRWSASCRPPTTAGTGSMPPTAVSSPTATRSTTGPYPGSGCIRRVGPPQQPQCAHCGHGPVL